MYCGRHAFHNYTKRKQYIDHHDTWSYGRRNRQKRRLNQNQSDEDDSETAEDETPLASDAQADRATYAEYEVSQNCWNQTRVVAGIGGDGEGNGSLAFLEV